MLKKGKQCETTHKRKDKEPRGVENITSQGSKEARRAQESPINQFVVEWVNGRERADC